MRICYAVLSTRYAVSGLGSGGQAWLALTAIVLVLTGCGDAERPVNTAASARSSHPTDTPARTSTSRSADPAKQDSAETDGAAAPTAAVPLAARRYGGRTVDEWRQWMQRMDPLSPEAAAVVPGLIELVRDADLPWYTRRQAALTLGRIQPPATAAIPVLVELLDAPPGDGESPAAWAAKALALFGPEAKDAAPELARILENEASPLGDRLAALDALAQIGGAQAEAISAIIRTFARPPLPGADERAETRHELRVLSAEALAVIGPDAKPAVPHLIRALSDRSEAVRRKSASALGAIGPAAEIAIERLLDVMGGDDSPAVRDAAEDALARVGPAALEALVGLWDYEDAELRARIIAILGRLGEAAEPELERIDLALDHPDARVRLAAAEAMWALTGEAADVVPALLDELVNPDRQQRMRAYRLLIALGPDARRAIPPLERMLEDPRAYVRRAAAEALRKLERDVTR